VILHCNFDLEGDELYSVKYYKDYVEFYRYLPTEEPRQGQKFKLKGAYVDVSIIYKGINIQNTCIRHNIQL